MAYFRCISKSTPKYKKYLGQLIERVSASTPKITESGHDTDAVSWYAFDGINTTSMSSPTHCWLATNSDTDAWIQYEFNRLYWFNKITIKCFSNYSGDWVGNIKVLGSTDGVNWENILSTGINLEITAKYQEMTYVEIDLNDSSEYQYIRIQADNNAFTVYYSPSICFDEIYVYGGVIASSELEDILTGVNNPSSDLGVNGQVYLKYIDYNNLYDFKEYIEVGSTAGAYINTGVNCTNTAYFEVDFNFTGSHSESRVFGCGAGGGAMFLIQNYNFDYMSAGENSISNVYQIPDANNRHKYKANVDGIYVDDVLVDTNVHWDNALPQRHYNLFAIDWDGTNYYATNARVYSCKIWNGDILVRYFVPVERKSDNEAGMLDIITGIFYDNDGTQSFTVGGTPSITFDYPITQAYSKINSTWQNLIGTDVRKIMSGQKEPKLYTNAIYYPNSQQITDVSNFTKLYDTTNTIDYGILGTRVENALALTDETTITSYMNGGWDRPQSCFYDSENKIGAYGGYIFDSARVINSAKFWLGRYSAQNNKLTVTIEVLDSNGNWNEITDLDITTDLVYPVNIFEVLITQEIYGIRWIHKKIYKTTGNNICFFGMTLYEGIGGSIDVYIPDKTGYIEVPAGYDGIGALVLQ